MVDEHRATLSASVLNVQNSRHPSGSSSASATVHTPSATLDSNSVPVIPTNPTDSSFSSSVIPISNSAATSLKFDVHTASARPFFPACLLRETELPRVSSSSSASGMNQDSASVLPDPQRPLRKGSIEFILSPEESQAANSAKSSSRKRTRLQLEENRPASANVNTNITINVDAAESNPELIKREVESPSAALSAFNALMREPMQQHSKSALSGRLPSTISEEPTASTTLTSPASIPATGSSSPEQNESAALDLASSDSSSSNNPEKKHKSSKYCIVEGCTSRAKHSRKCWKHGGSIKCKVENCTNRAKSKGVCWSHGGGTICSYKNCDTISVSNGFCWAHGGGKRCLLPNCSKPAYERTQNLCATHYEEYLRQQQK